MGISLEQHVKNWVADKAQDYDGNQLAVLKDLQHGGCQSGMVNHLIYNSDCAEFCHEYWQDIEDVISEMKENTGDSNFLFGEDGFSFYRLAWLAFEETAFKALSDLENTEEAA